MFLLFAVIAMGASAQAGPPSSSIVPPPRPAVEATPHTESAPQRTAAGTDAEVVEASGQAPGSVASGAVASGALDSGAIDSGTVDPVAVDPVAVDPRADGAALPPSEVATDAPALPSDIALARLRPVSRPAPSSQTDEGADGSVIEVAAIRPRGRPAPGAAVPAGAARPSALAVGRALRPEARPAARIAALAAESRQSATPRQPATTSRSAPVATVATATAVPPANRPRGLASLFRRAAQPAPPQSGSVCGIRSIRGEPRPPIRGDFGGCGVAEPVRITEVAGVRLSTAATIDCPTARALHAWVEQGAKPALERFGGGLAALQVAAHYVCKTRNSQPGARISEHGKGRAVDISAFVLENGQRITVKQGWRSSQTGPTLKRIHAAACGPFGTVLGPNSDRFHQGHFHLDTARYRSGPYCR